MTLPTQRGFGFDDDGIDHEGSFNEPKQRAVVTAVRCPDQGERKCNPAVSIPLPARTKERPVKYLTLITLAACTLAAGCASYTERTVVQKPAPAQSAVYTTTPVPSTTTTTTSVSVN
jgi:hypothetical protein